MIDTTDFFPKWFSKLYIYFDGIKGVFLWFNDFLKHQIAGVEQLRIMMGLLMKVMAEKAHI